MQIFIKTLTGKTFMLKNIGTLEFIENIKRKIQDKVGIPYDQQCLIFADKILDNDYTIAYYNITKTKTQKDPIYLRTTIHDEKNAKGKDTDDEEGSDDEEDTDDEEEGSDEEEYFMKNGIKYLYDENYNPYIYKYDPYGILSVKSKFDEFDVLIDPENHPEWAGLSLREKCVLTSRPGKYRDPHYHNWFFRELEAQKKIEEEAATKKAEA